MSTQEGKNPEHRSLAPWLIIGSMVVGMTTTTTIVLTQHCKREEPYLDPTYIKKIPRAQQPVQPVPKKAPL